MRSAKSRDYAPIILAILLAGSLGCQPPSATESADASSTEIPAESVTVEEEIEFGPGELNLADPRVGLAEAPGYESTLTIAFEGTQAGKPVGWSNTFTLAASGEPGARQLNIETLGDQAEPPVLMLEMNGVAYQRAGDDYCMARVLDVENSRLGELEPAAQLPSLFGAEAAGTETVNGVPAERYTFDERALAEAGRNKTTGEVWLATDGGHVLRYLQTTTGDPAYFGEDTAGTLTYHYELKQINQPVTVTLPADCPPGLVDAPMLPDATMVENRPGLLEYQTASSVQDAVAFYKQELPKLGWAEPSSGGGLPEGMTQEEYQRALELLQSLGGGAAPLAMPTENPNDVYLVFDRGAETMDVVITRAEQVTQVSIGIQGTAAP